MSLLVWAVSISLAACSGSPAPPPDAGLSDRGGPLYVEGVPFYPQVEYQCGPASLAAVLSYWGKPISPDRIAQEIYMPKLRGTLSLDMWQYALSQGVQAEVEEGSLATLAAHVSRQEPVVAFLNLGYRWMPVGHFVVVVGLDPRRQEVIAYSGTEKDSRISYRDFVTAWGKTKFWSLIVTTHPMARSA